MDERGARGEQPNAPPPQHAMRTANIAKGDFGVWALVDTDGGVRIVGERPHLSHGIFAWATDDGERLIAATAVWGRR